ncbi:ornithine cyclodeaminase family protein [Herbaspirillum sp. RTI4]|uniref:ornithine cyclodeaminase family protein n=1 Tax=Herbaspirillum sp. RTI4 TaxID=3048640 RepID=UPI002AB37C7F|nr:ornithine cyclodeaminase family protein [Herbaspirillum sp. RTI4]MDY7579676.1 ornithine cyclodeaminase family protein [Herbaspirillum sp. RTI4]MEA9981891.1 ornithine cyclodeaminase family protein [Herbaspirillum sp. RTI4]
MFQPESLRIKELLPFNLLVPGLREAFITGAHVPLRHTHHIEVAGGVGTSLLMPAWTDEGFYGVKIVNIFPANRNEGLPGLHSTYVLYSARTGEPLAILDGDEITSRRTAAAAALGASFLARKDASRLLIAGAGRVGSLIAPAMAAVREIRQVDIWDINPEAAQRCVRTLLDQGFQAKVVDDLASAVRSADIVSCATLAEEPFVQASWLSPGSHLDLIGSFTPQMTEAEPACFTGASLWIDTMEAVGKSGDLLNAFKSGAFNASDVAGTLEALCRGQCRVRESDEQRTIFKAVGTALEDLAAATLIYRRLVAEAE